jgi:hypothetical protein
MASVTLWKPIPWHSNSAIISITKKPPFHLDLNNLQETFMDGVIRIEKVVAMLEVWFDATFPFAKMKVKVLGRSQGDFLAVPNLAFRNPTSGEPEYTSGLGDTAEDAANDLLTRFVSEVRSYKMSNELTNEDFEWSAFEDF